MEPESVSRSDKAKEKTMTALTRQMMHTTPTGQEVRNENRPSSWHDSKYCSSHPGWPATARWRATRRASAASGLSP